MASNTNNCCTCTRIHLANTFTQSNVHMRSDPLSHGAAGAHSSRSHTYLAFFFFMDREKIDVNINFCIVHKVKWQHMIQNIKLELPRDRMIPVIVTHTKNNIYIFLNIIYSQVRDYSYPWQFFLLYKCK